VKESAVKGNNGKLGKAVDLIRAKGFDGLIIFSRGICDILMPGYLYYFTGFKPMGPRNAAVISKDGDSVLLVEPKWDRHRAAGNSCIPDVSGCSDFLTDLTQAMERFNISGPVGVMGSKEMPRNVFAAVAAQARPVLADDFVEEIAREKTSREIDLVRQTAKIADIGFKAFVNTARFGIREYELAAEMEAAMRAAGADDTFNLLSSGKHNFEMHEPTDRRLEKGDVLIGEISAVREGQVIQLCRTVVMGRPSSAQKEKFDLIFHALEETLKQVKAGVPAAIISKTMNKVISAAGYDKYCYPPYMRARGHGFGLGSVAPGAVIADDTKTDLIKDQVVVIHPNQWFPETGYLACGETYLVTASGVERLVDTETKLYVKEE